MFYFTLEQIILIISERARAMVLNVTFNYISVRVIGGETVVPRENHRSAQVNDKLYHILLY
jgi:hypothetical protein